MALVFGALLFVSAPVVGTLAQVANAVQGTAPSAPTGGLPNDSAVRTNDFYFTWNASVDANPGVTYQFQSSMNPATDAKGVLTTSVWHSGTLPTPQIHSTGAPDGTWYWQVRAIDTAGNVGNWSQVWKVTIDTIAPSVPQNGTPNNSSLDTNDFYFNWGASTDANPGVTYQFQSSMNPATDGKGVLTTSVWHSGTLPTPQIHSVGAPNGTWYWQVRAIDAAGNVSAWSQIWKMTIVPDTTGPTVQITSPAAPGYVKGMVTMSGTVTDSHPDHYYYVVKDSTGKVVAYPPSSNGGVVYQKQVQDWQWDTTKLLDGVYTIDLEARDALGNKGPQSVQTLKVTVDNTIPTAAIKLASTATPSASTDMTFTGKVTTSTVANLKQLELFIDGTDKGDITTNVKPDGTWSYTLVGGLDKGDHTIAVVATDVAGNVSTETTAPSVTVTVSGYVVPPSEGKGTIDSSLAPQPISQTIVPAQPAAIVIASATPTRGNSSTVNSAVPTQTTAPNDSSVLGAESTKSPATLSASTVQPITPSANGWTFFGIAWYWWLLLLALMIGVGSWAKVAINRRREIA